VRSILMQIQVQCALDPEANLNAEEVSVMQQSPSLDFVPDECFVRTGKAEWR
jgi:hypothetical protein